MSAPPAPDEGEYGIGLAVALADERTLVAVAAALLDDDDRVAPSASERAVIARARGGEPDAGLLAAIRTAILAGGDPLGDGFAIARTAEARRSLGQVFTPSPIIEHMVGLAAEAEAVGQGPYAAVIDCGCGSGRYLREAARRFPEARLIGVEIDPLCALLARASLAVAGLSSRSVIVPGDFRAVDPLTEGSAAEGAAEGRRLFIGNPPYLRHHAIDERWKAWYVASVTAHGLPRPSKLAGLHLHFFARTAELARRGDVGVFVTAAEWLDTGYGAALRRLLLGPLGGRSIVTVDATQAPFPGTLSTAAITLFRPGEPADALTLGEAPSVAHLDRPETRAHPVDDPALATGRWSILMREDRNRDAGDAPAAGRVGDLFRVSRGQVTGCNAAFVVGPATPALPERMLMPCVTGAEQIFAAALHDHRLTSRSKVGRVVCLPGTLGGLNAAERRQVREFMEWAVELGADRSYTARHRSPWWRVAMADPAPILMSYMARRPPALVRNDIGAGIINVAHGLRPRVAMTAAELDRACAFLNAAVTGAVGRVYAGGLMKFEPRAVEALPVDWSVAGLDHLATGAAAG